MSWGDVFSTHDMDTTKASRSVRDALKKLASHGSDPVSAGFWGGWGAVALRAIERGPDHALLQLPMSKRACEASEFGKGEAGAYALMEAAGADPEFRGWLAFVKSAHDVMETQSPLGVAAAVVVRGAPAILDEPMRPGFEAAAAALMHRDGDIVTMIREDLVDAAVKFSRK